MDKTKIIRKERKTEEKVGISVRIPESASVFMREKNYSPTGIFMEALKDLGWEPKITEEKKEE